MTERERIELRGAHHLDGRTVSLSNGVDTGLVKVWLVDDRPFFATYARNVTKGTLWRDTGERNADGLRVFEMKR